MDLVQEPVNLHLNASGIIPFFWSVFAWHLSQNIHFGRDDSHFLISKENGMMERRKVLSHWFSRHHFFFRELRLLVVRNPLMSGCVMTQNESTICFQFRPCQNIGSDLVLCEAAFSILLGGINHWSFFRLAGSVFQAVEHSSSRSKSKRSVHSNRIGWMIVR